MSDTIPTVELREVWVVSNPEHCVRGLGCTRDEALAAAANHYSESVPACFELSGTDATFASNGWYVIRIPLAIPPAAPVPPVVACDECDGEGVTAEAVCCGSGFGNECCGCPDQRIVPCSKGCKPRLEVVGCAARYIAALDRVAEAKTAREVAQTARGLANKGDVIAEAHRALAAATDERDAALEVLRAALTAALRPERGEGA